MTEINTNDIKELFSQYGFIIVGNVNLNKEENIIYAYIEVGPTDIYTIQWIEEILKKIKSIRTILTEAFLIEDITLGDLYKGSWRILIRLSI